MSELKPFKEERPWGSFTQFTHDTPSTVKILFIKKGEAFSLQYHNLRTEFWKVLSGDPEITIGEKVIAAKAGDEFNISPQTNHRIRAKSSDAEVLEISTGTFEENDIVRLEDQYGRA